MYRGVGEDNKNAQQTRGEEKVIGEKGIGNDQGLRANLERDLLTSRAATTSRFRTTGANPKREKREGG